MHHHYADIRDRIDEPPKWWDENAVPRYCDFEPGCTADIYANEVVLLQIECQACGYPFDVCISWPRVGVNGNGAYINEPLDEDAIQALHYGDPPNGCCGIGATMNSIPRRVLQFWRRTELSWGRVPELEVPIDCDWWDDE